jgi:hypothetical protein
LACEESGGSADSSGDSANSGGSGCSVWLVTTLEAQLTALEAQLKEAWRWSCDEPSLRDYTI